MNTAGPKGSWTYKRKLEEIPFSHLFPASLYTVSFLVTKIRLSKVTCRGKLILLRGAKGEQAGRVSKFYHEPSFPLPDQGCAVCARMANQALGAFPWDPNQLLFKNRQNVDVEGLQKLPLGFLNKAWLSSVNVSAHTGALLRAPRSQTLTDLVAGNRHNPNLTLLGRRRRRKVARMLDTCRPNASGSHLELGLCKNSMARQKTEGEEVLGKYFSHTVSAQRPMRPHTCRRQNLRTT